MVAAGSAGSHCLPPRLAHRAGLKQLTNKGNARLGLHGGNRDKLLQKLSPEEAAEQEEQNGGAGEETALADDA